MLGIKKDAFEDTRNLSVHLYANKGLSGARDCGKYLVIIILRTAAATFLLRYQIICSLYIEHDSNQSLTVPEKEGRGKTEAHNPPSRLCIL